MSTAIAVKGRWRCEECGHVSTVSEMLTAPNPFADTDEVLGCPGCRACNPEWIELCDTCDSRATCGTPTADGGYRRTCYKHRP